MDRGSASKIYTSEKSRKQVFILKWNIKFNREFSNYETQMAKEQFINVELGGWGGGKDLGGVGGGESVIQIYFFSKIISDYIFDERKEKKK